MDGACTTDTVCGHLLANRICLPNRAFDNSTQSIVEVEGLANQLIVATPPLPSDAVVPVWTACTDANFQGNCFLWCWAGDGCLQFTGIWVNSLSSIRMQDSRIGCNFFVTWDCIGNAINIDSDAIFNLAATDYNDRIVAFKCYWR